MNAPNPQPRPYRRNSAEAAARVVALALIANGRIKAVETAALDALRAHERLGLTRPQWHGVIHDLCADLQGPARCGDEGCIPGELLDRMLDEVDDDTTQRLVLRLCSAVVHADRQVDDGESFVLLALIERWGLHPDDHALLEPMLYGTDFQVRPRSVAAEAGHKLRLR
jgi:tellurite resistance protein